MTSFGTLKADTLTHSTAGSLATNFVVKGSAKAFVKGSDAAVAAESFNIGSGTDNGTGDYTYAFTNSMSSANYTINTDCHSGGLSATNKDSQAAGSYKVQVFDRGNSSLGGSKNDTNYSAIHGDLA